MSVPVFRTLLLIVSFIGHAGLCIASEKNDAPPITLNIPVQGNENDRYFIDLIERAFSQMKLDIKVVKLKDIARKRQVEFLKQNKLSLVWRLKAGWRDKMFSRVNVGLTDGAIGQRVFLIPKGTQPRFQGIKNKHDFITRNLVAVFGENWFDVAIWQFNNLPHVEISGRRDKIFTMLNSGNRGFDYFSRGIIQIKHEHAMHPELDIESGLLLEYDSDYYLYLNSELAYLKKGLENVLNGFSDNGVISELLNKHFGDLAVDLKLNQRAKIKLEMPELDQPF